MTNPEYRPTLSVEEVSKRLDLASNKIDLGAGSLLGSGFSSSYTTEDAERSLERLLNRIQGTTNQKEKD